MELVTGRAGTPHITSQQDRQRNQGTFGNGAYILKTGNQLAPVVQSSNKIQIKDGALMFQGALFSVKVGTVDEVTIANGSQGMQRKDLIVARYNYDAGENVESAKWAVIQGTPAASNPVAPSYTEGDIQAGDTTVECPVLIATLDGINITGVELVPEIAPDVPEIMAQLEELNSKLIDTGWVKESENYNFYYRKVINTVWVWCYSTNEYEINGTNKNLFTLPEGCRPGRWIQTVGSLREVGQGANTQIEVSSSGVVSICTLGQTARKLWSALLCFPASDLI